MNQIDPFLPFSFTGMVYLSIYLWDTLISKIPSEMEVALLHKGTPPIKKNRFLSGYLDSTYVGKSSLKSRLGLLELKTLLGGHSDSWFLQIVWKNYHKKQRL